MIGRGTPEQPNRWPAEIARASASVRQTVGDELRIDHVAIAGRDLSEMQRAFAGIGLEPEYGGVHSNEATHMSLLAFDDGSYLELISTVRPGIPAPLWSRYIEQDAGPAGWATEVADVAAEVARANAVSIPVEGPTYYHRQRPDGTLVEWDMAFLGAGQPGQTLPFVIHDRTPRSHRVQPSASVTGSELEGVDSVVIAVHALGPVASRFQALFGWNGLISERHAPLGATVSGFPDTPVALAIPDSPSDWLSDRLNRLGEGPCAVLLKTRDFQATASRLPLGPPTSWFGRRIAWVDPEKILGTRLAIVG